MISLQPTSSLTRASRSTGSVFKPWPELNTRRLISVSASPNLGEKFGFAGLLALPVLRPPIQTEMQAVARQARRVPLRLSRGDFRPPGEAYPRCRTDWARAIGTPGRPSIRHLQ